MINAQKYRQIRVAQIALKKGGGIEMANKSMKTHYSLHAVFPSFPTMEEVEKVMIKEALMVAEGNKGAAADLLGICRQTFARKFAEIEK